MNTDQASRRCFAPLTSGAYALGLSQSPFLTQHAARTLGVGFFFNCAKIDPCVRPFLWTSCILSKFDVMLSGPVPSPPRLCNSRSIEGGRLSSRRDKPNLLEETIIKIGRTSQLPVRFSPVSGSKDWVRCAFTPCASRLSWLCVGLRTRSIEVDFESRSEESRKGRTNLTLQDRDQALNFLGLSFGYELQVVSAFTR